MGRSDDGLFLNRNTTAVNFVTPVPAGDASMAWSESPVSQPVEGIETVLSWPDDPRRRDVSTVGAIDQTPTSHREVRGVATAGPGWARVQIAGRTARNTAASVPAAFSGSTDMAAAPAARTRPPPMELSFLPLRNTAPASSFAQESRLAVAASQSARVADAVRGASTAAVPPTVRRAPAASRSRSPSPKRRQPASARGTPARGPVAAPITLESLAVIVSSGFKDMDGKLGKIQKSVDGVSAVVSTHADKFNSMAVLAESVTIAQSATATAVAEMRAASEKTMAAAQGAIAGTSQKSTKAGAQEQRMRDRQQANAIKVSARFQHCSLVFL